MILKWGKNHEAKTQEPKDDHSKAQMVLPSIYWELAVMPIVALRSSLRGCEGSGIRKYILFWRISNSSVLTHHTRGFIRTYPNDEHIGLEV